ncbi:MAG: DNA mismatch repair endonuclease MutL [Ruminococcaceae bacterium]|nr:DNA mismatch repair endonuclease MutL [Oscillospiraceae bacterium]
MGKINKLPKNVWELIAAGEVVERPASVVKELMENSIDAGADSITLEIQNGGIRYIRITDNGCGIDRQDVPLAFVSHATSKISTASDLEAIGTLGFRGEALASVAAVSKVEMLTKTRGSETGTRIEIKGGEQISLDDAGCPDGTTVIIRDLFYNTPARMKFLKSDKSEGMAVAGIIDKIALSHPEIAIRFIKDGKQVICTNGNGNLKDAVYAVYGREFSDTLIPVEYETDSLKIHGFISKPYCARGSGSMQIFFVNNRFVKSRTASAALNEAYKNSIMVGKYPACVLFCEIRPELVDVNVHPAKTEVRFSNEKAIFDLVYYAAKNTLADDKSRPQASVPRSNPVGFNILTAPVPEAKQTSFADAVKPVISEIYGVRHTEEPVVNFSEPEVNGYAAEEEDTPDLSVSTYTAPETSAAQEPVKETTEEKPFRYLGEAFRTYIFAEYEGKIVIIDKHAAHERMIYNSLKKNNGANGSQMLLAPVNVTLSKEEYTAVTDNLDVLAEAGFEVEDFGNGSVIVRACPLNLENEDVTGLISELAAYLCENKKNIIPEKLDWIYHSVSCRAAIKAGNKQTDYELTEFAKKLLADDEVRFCPHGRPVLIEMTKNELDKQFGRIQ